MDVKDLLRLLCDSAVYMDGHWIDIMVHCFCGLRSSFHCFLKQSRESNQLRLYSHASSQKLRGWPPFGFLWLDALGRNRVRESYGFDLLSPFGAANARFSFSHLT